MELLTLARAGWRPRRARGRHLTGLKACVESRLVARELRRLQRAPRRGRCYNPRRSQQSAAVSGAGYGGTALTTLLR